MRAYRGDGHVAVLVARGVTPAESHQLKIAAGESDAEALRTGRGFADDAWADGRARLLDRGWIEAAGSLTAAGRRAHDELEAVTDAAAEQPWQAVGPAAAQRARTLLDPLARAVLRAGMVPQPNPVGLVAGRARSSRGQDGMSAKRL